VATEKEMMAFVERVASRASQRNSYRATFVALRPLVEGALAAGYSMKTTWETLCAEGKLTMTYETFRVHCRKAGLGHAAQEPPRVRAQVDEQPRVAVARASAMQRPDERPPAFRHNSMPQKDEIY
jgi:hypothetical protein